jgi:hypothetical protein
MELETLPFGGRRSFAVRMWCSKVLRPWELCSSHLATTLLDFATVQCRGTLTLVLTMVKLQLFLFMYASVYDCYCMVIAFRGTSGIFKEAGGPPVRWFIISKRHHI